MSGFNTKTPMMDWSSFMRRDFSKENPMGALADAFNVVADTADGYGQTADKKLINSYANETDASKIDNTPFYSQDNAIKAKGLVEQNNIKAFQDEQRKRANELNARSDAEYAINQFNKEAVGDAVIMDKASFDAKYKNAGGLDWAMMQDTFNKKEDRQFSIEDREQKNKLTNLQIQNTQNNINNQIEEKNYTKQQRENKKADEQNLNSLLSKYNSWDEFKKSEDWKNPEYNYTVKKTFYDSFGKGDKSISVNEQIKLEEINNNKKDLGRVQEEYKKTYGIDMPLSEQSKFVYKGELPKEMQTINKKPLSSKEANELDALIKYKDTLVELKNNHYEDSVGGWDNTTSALPEVLKSDKARRFEALMNDVLLGKTSALAGTLSDKDMALLKSSGLSQNLGDADFIKVRDNLMNKVDTLINDRYDLLSESYKMPEQYRNIKNQENTNNNQTKITSIRKKDTTTTNTKTIISTGTTPDGRKVNKYSDGSIEYAN